MSRWNPLNPGEETLRRLYVGESKSLAEIARLYGVNKTSVSTWLRQAGISTRSISEATILSGKYGVHSEAHREKLRANAVIARQHITPEGLKRGGEKRRGRTPPNKGVPWSDEVRAKHMATRATDEYKENLAASLRGEKNYNWKGGVTPESAKQLQGWPWRKRRHEVYARDNWTCQDCGCHCLNSRDARLHPKRKIQAHHIVARRDGGSDELENLVTLCMSCHHKRERGDKCPASGTTRSTPISPPTS